MQKGEKIAQFVSQLVSLTDKNKLGWVESFFGHTCKHENANVFVSWLSGDRPSISINGNSIEGLCYGIQELVSAIFRYYQRNKKGRYSPKQQKALKKSRVEIKKQAREEIAAISGEIDQINKSQKGES